MKLFITFFFFCILSINQTFGQGQGTIDSLSNCLEVATNDTNKVDILIKLSAKYSKRNPATSESYATKALCLSKKINYKEGTIESYNFIGVANYYKGNSKIVLENFKKSLEICYEIGDKKKIGDLLNNIGIVIFDLGDHNKAINYYEKSLHIKEKIGDKNGIAVSLNSIGIANEAIGNYNTAIEYYKRSLSVFEDIKDKKGISVCLNNIGYIHGILGNYSKKIESYKKSIKIKEEIGDKIGISASLMNIGIVYADENYNEKAMEFYQKSLTMAKMAGYKTGIAKCLLNIGNLFRDEANYSLALKYYQKSLKIKKDFGDKKGIAICLLKLGTVYSEQGNYIKGIEYFKKSLKIREQIGDKQGKSFCFEAIGDLFLRQKKYDEALHYFSQKLQICKEIDSKIDIIRTFNLLAKVSLHQENYQNALRYYQKALILNLTEFNDSNINQNPKYLNALNKTLLLETLSNKAKTIYLLSKKEDLIKSSQKAVRVYDLVFKLITIIRSNYNHEDSKLLFSKNTKGYFADALLIAFEYSQSPHNDMKVFFEYLEKSKSAIILSYINNQKENIHFNLHDSLIEKEKTIIINRRFCETNIQQAQAKKEGYDTTLVQNYQDKLFDYSRQYESLVAIFKENYPDYYQLKYEQKVANIEELQQKMDDKTTILNYFVADTSLFIAAITKDSLIYKIVKTDSSFNQLLTDYHIDIEFDFTEKELQASKKLYSYLIAPIEDLIEGKNKLVILPDEKLYYVPFETLCKKGEDFTQPDYLVRNYAINYHHSATLWLNSKTNERKSVASNSFIGFAPVFDPLVNNGTILSNEWLADTTQTDVATRSVSNDFNHFNALPNSEKEIKSILKLFKKKDGKAEGYLHKEATEENFKNNVSNYKYVHIASHSFTNDKYPALSGIAFSQPDTTLRKENDEDGILYAGESYNLNLSNADLVVLSSCKSGLGKLIKGEGFLSLSRGFIYSGAPNIVYSLWSVKDEPTKDLMVYFYKQLLNGKNYAEALRDAKLKILSNPKTSQPKYWAAWVLLGM